MPDLVQIGYLADHTAHVPEMRAAFIAAWPEQYGSAGRGDAAADIHAFCRSDRLPIGLVAVAAGRLWGTVTLRATTESHAHLGPWLTGLLVVPERRRQGIGTRLIRAAEKLAESLGHNTLYARSASAEPLFHGLGWTAVDSVASGHQLLTVFQRQVATQPSGSRASVP